MPKFILTTSKENANKIHECKDNPRRNISTSVIHYRTYSDVEIEYLEIIEVAWLMYHIGYSSGLENR